MSSSDSNASEMDLLDQGHPGEDDGPSTVPINSCGQRALGYSLAVGAVLCMAISACCAQALGGLIPPFQLNAWRYTVQLLLVSTLMAWKCQPIFPERKYYGWMVIRCLSSSAINILYYTAAIYLPLGTLGALQPSVTIILSAVGTLILDRGCSDACQITAAILFCITGVFLITQPDIIFGKLIASTSAASVYKPPCGSGREYSPGNVLDTPNYTTGLIPATPASTVKANLTTDVLNTARSQYVSYQTVGYILATAGAVASVTAMFVTYRKLLEMNPFVIAFWICVSGVTLSLITVPIFEELAFPSSLLCCGALLGHAMSAACASMFAIIGSQILPPVIFTLPSTMQPVLLFISQYTVMKSINPGKGNAVEIVGAVVIVVGNGLKPAFKLYGYISRVLYRELSN